MVFKIGRGKKKAPLGLTGTLEVPAGVHGARACEAAGMPYVHSQAHAVCRVSDTSETILLTAAKYH